jgi:hypothetical protein
MDSTEKRRSDVLGRALRNKSNVGTKIELQTLSTACRRIELFSIVQGDGHAAAARQRAATT